MPFQFWGALEMPRLTQPQRPLMGYFLLLLYVGLFAYTLYRHRRFLRRLTRRQWGGIVLLALAALTVGQLFPLSLTFERQLPPPGAAQNPRALLLPFSAAPFLLAGAALNPAAALLIGFAAGLGRSLWHTHQLYDPFYFAFVALLASWLMHQHYRGRFYRWLRHPVVAGAITLPALLPVAPPGGDRREGRA